MGCKIMREDPMGAMRDRGTAACGRQGRTPQRKQVFTLPCGCPDRLLARRPDWKTRWKTRSLLTPSASCSATARRSWFSTRFRRKSASSWLARSPEPRSRNARHVCANCSPKRGTCSDSGIPGGGFHPSISRCRRRVPSRCSLTPAAADSLAAPARPPPPVRAAGRDPRCGPSRARRVPALPKRHPGPRARPPRPLPRP